MIIDITLLPYHRRYDECSQRVHPSGDSSLGRLTTAYALESFAKASSVDTMSLGGFFQQVELKVRLFSLSLNQFN